MRVCVTCLSVQRSEHPIIHKKKENTPVDTVGKICFLQGVAHFFYFATLCR